MRSADSSRLLKHACNFDCKHAFKAKLYIAQMNTFLRIKKLVTGTGVADHKVRSTLAKLCGVTPQAVGEWESGKTKRISPEYLAKIAAEYGVSVEYLITGRDSLINQKNSKLEVREQPFIYSQLKAPLAQTATLLAPVVDGTLAATHNCGRDTPIEYWPLRPALNSIADRLLYFMATDNSMYAPLVRKSLSSGDVALIELGAAPAPGDLVLCVPNGSDEALLRVYKVRGKDDFELAPYNEDWASISVSDPESCRILGVSREIHIRVWQ